MKKLMNYRFALHCAVSLVAAIVSSYFFFVKDSAVLGFLSGGFVFAGLILMITVCAVFKKDKLKTAIFFVLITAILSLAVFVKFYAVTDNYKNADLGNAYLTVSGRIERVENFGGGKSVVLSSVEYSGRLKGSNGYKLFVNIYGENSFDVGDTIVFSAVIQDKSLFYERKFSAADVESGIKYYASVNSYDVEVSDKSLNMFETVNVAVRDKLSEGLDKDEFTVAYALILGNAEYSDSNVLESYRQAGVAHVFAVSGLHIGFLAAVLGFLFRKTRINPYVSAAIICGLLLFYSGVCGFTASSVRATVMCGVSLFVAAAGGRYDGLSSVSVAAIIILLISPVQLFCAGFVLSFSVVIGIMLAAKPIGKLFPFFTEKLSAAVGAVIAAFLFSAPVLIIFFGELSLFAVISNLVFIPIVGVIYIFLLVSVILSFISPSVFLFVPNAVLKAVNFAVHIIDYKPFIIGGITLTFATVLYYAALIVPTGLFNLKTLTKAVLSAALATAFIGLTALNSVRENSAVKAYFIGSYGICATVIESKNERTVVVSYAVKGFPVNRIGRLIGINGEKTTDFIILSDIDVNMTLTRCYALTSVRSVYFYEGEGALYEKSFKGVNFIETGTNSVTFSEYTAEIKEKGKAVKISAYGKSALIFAELKNDVADFVEKENGCDIVVAYDYLERIAAANSGSAFLSYRNSLNYSDAEKSGNYLFKFN